MATSVPVSGRTVAVRLVDVPVAIRRRYGRALVDRAYEEGDVLEVIRLNTAIEEPSDRVYWLPADSVAKVLK